MMLAQLVCRYSGRLCAMNLVAPRCTGTARRLATHPVPDPEHHPPPLTVKQVYKNLLHLGKDFPKGYEYFRDRCKIAFMKNREVSDPHQVEVLLARAVYVTKELEALYMLKKYRTLKKRYYAEELK